MLNSLDFSLDSDILNALGQTFSPSHCEVEILKNVISNLRDFISSTETDPSAKIEAEKKLHNAASLLAPVRRVPQEIMAEIFYYTSYKDISPKGRRSPSDTITSDTAPLVLFRVCRLWRRIALDTPRIFTFLLVLPKTSLSVIPMWLKYSKTAPLEVFINVDEKKAATIYAENVFEEMRSHLHRIRTLVTSFGVHLPYLFPSGTLVHLPLLQRLSLIYPSRPRDIGVGSFSAPAIQELYSGINFPWEDHLALGDQLTVFRCNAHRVLSPRSLLRLFTQFPQLKYCDVVYWEDLSSRVTEAEHFRIHCTDPILLPHLEALTRALYLATGIFFFLLTMFTMS